MKIAVWIIAICEVIRAAQNMIQLWHIKKDEAARDNLNAQFIKHLKDSDKEFVNHLLEEFERQEAENDD